MSNIINHWHLEDSELTTLLLDPYDGNVAVTSYDIGQPVVREVSAPFPDRDGAVDNTAYTGRRLVTLELRILGDAAQRQATMAALRRYWQPRRRPSLVWTGAYYPTVRAVGRGGSLVNTVAGAGPFAVQAQWVVPSGLWESYTEKTLTLPPSGGSVAGGRTYDLTFDRTYPALATPLGTNLAVNDGDVPVDFIARLYGPCNDAGTLQNLTVGYLLDFRGAALSLSSSDYLEINTRERTVLLNGQASHYEIIDWSTSQWWQLAPGGNSLRFQPTNPSGACQAIMTWRDAYS